jgi:hypothetical protein
MSETEVLTTKQWYYNCRRFQKIKYSIEENVRYFIFCSLFFFFHSFWTERGIPKVVTHERGQLAYFDLHICRNVEKHKKNIILKQFLSLFFIQMVICFLSLSLTEWKECREQNDSPVDNARLITGFRLFRNVTKKEGS